MVYGRSRIVVRMLVVIVLTLLSGCLSLHSEYICDTVLLIDRHSYAVLVFPVGSVGQSTVHQSWIVSTSSCCTWRLINY